MEELKDAGYGSRFDHLEDVCRYLSALMDVRTAEKRLSRPENKAENDPEQEELQAEVHTRKERLSEVRADLQRKTRATLEIGDLELPLERIGDIFGLSRFEKQALELVVCCQLFDELRRKLLRLYHSNLIQIKTVLDLFCGSLEEMALARKYFSEQSVMLSKGILGLGRTTRWKSETDFLSIGLHCPSWVFDRITGSRLEDRQLARYAEFLQMDVDMEDLLLPSELKSTLLNTVRNREDHLRIWREWQSEATAPSSRTMVLVLSGRDGSGRRTLASALAREAGTKCLRVRIDRILKEQRRAVEALRAVFFEARYHNAVLLFTDIDTLFNSRSGLCIDAFSLYVAEFEGIVILTSKRPHCTEGYFEDCFLREFVIPTPEAEAREKLWKRFIPEQAVLGDDVDLDEMAKEFEMTAGAIRYSIAEAAMRSSSREGGQVLITQDDLRASAQEYSNRTSPRESEGGNRGISALLSLRRSRADRKDLLDQSSCSVRLEDVVLPPKLKMQIRDIINAARCKEMVFEEWGFGGTTESGQSISVLFKGESGTGKTLTAEAVATEVDRKLYTVRGSELISKWVGESEKNITRVFRESNENEVLFFDEAESIFTSRVEADDAHSEMINRRISCLLREIELYSGVIILATNYPSLIDKSFERRIRFKVTFPLPDREAREAIWRVNIPADAPLAEDVDFEELAEEFEFTGGQIWSVILRAAFSAASREVPLSRELLFTAAQEEEPFVVSRTIGFREMEEDRQ